VGKISRSPRQVIKITGMDLISLEELEGGGFILKKLKK